MSNERDDQRIAEANDLLGLAESIQERYEVLTRRWILLRTQIALLTILVAAAIIGVYLFSDIRDTVRQYVLAVGILYLVLILVFAFMVYERQRGPIAREARALAQVVAILHEIEASASDLQQWTALERAQFRIRLARFEIEPYGLRMVGPSARNSLWRGRRS
ncbi:hypothetical protein ABTW72_05185 [Micromonospora sp. NPDC127501]|uniref:hypothetical protein n=1 Tax=Micromonospora sp. NPDC127501 TaxID=3154872 RepID=UPI00331A8AF6